MRIVVKNLPKFIKEDEIKNAFCKYGKITNIFMIYNDTGDFRRICFIGFESDDSCKKAVEERNNTYFLNHKIRCEIVKNSFIKKSNESDERIIKYTKKIFIKDLPMNVEQDNIVKKLKSYGEIENTEFITKKDKLYCVVKYKNKDDALSVYSEMSEMFAKNVKVLPYRDLGDNKKLDHYNTLFFNLETVIKRIAECERLEDYNIVDIKDKDLATRMALLEAHLVNQTKEFLKRNNIDLDNLTNEKNKKVLIVRNINVEKCLDFVEKGCKISIAPSSTVALIKFDEEEKAYRCYKKLNLKRFEDTVVYCEFAPLCKISTIETKDVPVESNNDNKLNKLLVKNVPFQASKDEIFKLFSGKFKVLDVRIPQKRDGGSRGFAFVTFDSPETVKKVIEYFGKSTHLYGRRLVLEMAKE